MFLAVFSSLVCWIDLLLQMVKWFFSVVTLLYLVTEFCLEVSEVEHVVTRRYSSQLQLSSKTQNVCVSVCLLVNKSYGTSRHLIFPKLGQKLEDNK